MAIGADKLICIIDGPILDESGHLIRFLPLQEADMLIRKRAKQSDAAANYVKAVDEEGFNSLECNNFNGTVKSPPIGCFTEWHNATFHNGVGFESGNGLGSGEQGFAIGGQERLSRMNGYLSELAAAAFVCRVSPCFTFIFHDKCFSCAYFKSILVYEQLRKQKHFSNHVQTRSIHTVYICFCYYKM